MPTAENYEESTNIKVIVSPGARVRGLSHIREFAQQPPEPPGGCLALRKLVASGYWMAGEVR
jgi:hypothetical protein